MIHKGGLGSILRDIVQSDESFVIGDAEFWSLLCIFIAGIAKFVLARASDAPVPLHCQCCVNEYVMEKNWL